MTTTIRQAVLADAPQVAGIYAPYVSDAVISFELEPPDAAEMARRMFHARAYPWLVCAGSGGDLLGYAYASQHRERAAYQWSVDVTVYVRIDQHRRGVGRALYTSLFGILRAQGFHAAHAGVTLPNAASVGLHESFGFRAVGVYPAVGYKLGAWHDVGWWQLELRARRRADVPPAPPLAVDDALAGGAAAHLG